MQIGPSLLVFKTAGRIKSALHTGASSGVGGAPALPAPGGVAEEQDVTFGVFVAGKWTYDMVKKDVEGDGLDGAKCVMCIEIRSVVAPPCHTSSYQLMFLLMFAWHQLLPFPAWATKSSEIGA